MLGNFPKHLEQLRLVQDHARRSAIEQGIRDEYTLEIINNIAASVVTVADWFVLNEQRIKEGDKNGK